MYWLICFAAIVIPGAFDYVFLLGVDAKRLAFRIHIVLWIIAGCVIFWGAKKIVSK